MRLIPFILFLFFSVSKKGKERWIVDTSYVGCSHHCYQAIAISDPQCKVLVLGLGGGGLCLFLHRMFPNISITAVDIDPAIVDVAKKHFDVTEHKNLQIQVCIYRYRYTPGQPCLRVTSVYFRS